MDGQERLRIALRSHLETVQKSRPSFSMRSFAKHLGIPAGNLSQFLSGKRRFSQETTKSIIHQITDNPESRKNLLDEINELELEGLRRKRGPSTSDYEATTLSAEEFLLLDEWYYFAVRTVLSLANPVYEVKWIASQLGISEDKADKALKLLYKMKLIELDPEGRIVRTKKHLMTPDSVKKDPRLHEAKLKLHEQHIEHTLYSLRNHDVSERDITWVNIPTNPQKLDRARELIRKFQDDMLAILEDEAPTDLYRMTVQLCPLSQAKR